MTITNAVETNRKILVQETGLTHLRYCRQIHSASVVHVDKEVQPLAEHIPEADALVTAKHDIALCIFTADCIPIFVLDVETPAIGIVHAGWRGTFARIAVNAITEMKSLFGTLPKNCQIHLGPSIQKCCYTVSTELLTQFTTEFGSTVANGTNLSLQTANVNQLTEIGMPIRLPSPYLNSVPPVAPTYFTHIAPKTDRQAECSHSSDSTLKIIR